MKRTTVLSGSFFMTTVYECIWNLDSKFRRNQLEFQFNVESESVTFLRMQRHIQLFLKAFGLFTHNTWFYCVQFYIIGQMKQNKQSSWLSAKYLVSWCDTHCWASSEARKYSINIVYVAMLAKKTFCFNLACGKPSHPPGLSNEAWPCRTCFGSAWELK